MSKKKVLFVLQYMELGGIERALLGFFEQLDFTQYEVDLFIHRHSGELMPYIPQQVKVLSELQPYALLTQPITKCIMQGFIRIALARLWAKLKATFFNIFNSKEENDSIFQYVAMATERFLPAMSITQYDVAISFITPHVFVLSKVNAKKKIAWIHTDYTSVNINTKAEFNTWQAYDAIVAVSDQAKAAFLNRFKGITSKVYVFENPLPIQLIQRESMAFVPTLSNGINFLTVGRFCYAKAQEEAVAIAYELVQKGWDIHWYFIGYGNEQPFWQAVDNYKLQDRIHHLGKLANPYPYMLACDYYVQPSRYEGKAVTVQEAQALHKTVIITNYNTAASQLEHNKNGYIVPMGIKAAANAIHNLLLKESKIVFEPSGINQNEISFHQRFQSLISI